MSLASVQRYIKEAVDGLGWPFGGIPNLEAHVKPPDPNVQSEIPAAYIWMQRGEETRDADRLRAGTIPRSAVPGGPSGTKAASHQVPLWLVWMMDTEDPELEDIWPGMIEAVQAALRGSAPAPNDAGQVENPALLTDPWTGTQSYLIDLGEDMRYDSDLRALENQRYLRLDAVISLTAIEVIAA